jgi:hypothetical protein
MIVEFSPLDLARQHRQAWRDGPQGLNAGYLVHRGRAVSVCSASLVDLEDIGAFGVEGGIGVRRFGIFFSKTFGGLMNVNIDVAASRRKNAKLSGGIADSSIYNAVLKALAENGARGRALDFGAATGTLRVCP